MNNGDETERTLFHLRWSMRFFVFGQRVRHRLWGTATVIGFSVLDDNGKALTTTTEDHYYLNHALLGINDPRYGEKIVILLDNPSLWKPDKDQTFGSPYCFRNDLTPLDEPPFKN